MKMHLLALSLSLFCACAYKGRIDDDVILSPELTIYQMQREPLQLFWLEWPQNSATRMTLDSAPTDCERWAVYVNPQDNQLNRLSSAGTVVAPLTLQNGSAELANWSRLPADRCTVQVIAGYLIDEAFMGLSFSTRDGVFRREAVKLPREKSGGWKLHALDGIVERLQQDYPAEWLDRVITVSFDFPGGHREETDLTLWQAAELLDGPFYRDAAFQIEQPWRYVRFWTRAALEKLKLDFREQEGALVSVGQARGKWQVDPRDGRSAGAELFYPLLDARYLRLNIAQKISQ